MSIKHMENGSWRVDVTVGKNWDGTQARHKRYVKTKKEAELLESQWNLEKQLNKGGVSADVDFETFVNQIYWPQKQGQIRETTRKGYMRDIKLRLMPAFGNVSVGKINRFAIQNMLNSCQTKKVATNARATLSAILTLAVEMGMISVNPAGFTYRYPAEAQHASDHYGVWLTTISEHVKLLHWMHEHYRNKIEERLVVIGLGLGLRKGEILALDWENVDLNEKTVRIVQTYTGANGEPRLTAPKTKRSKRVVPISSYTYERFLEWSTMEKHEGVNLEGKPCHPVVCGITGGRLSPSTAADRIARMRGGVYADGSPVPNITLFSLRHSWATAAINAGMEVSKVSAVLGHADTAVTYNRYVKPKLKDIRQDISLLDAEFEKATAA